MVTSVETELVRLRRENAELRAGLEARTQENAVLLQMIADVISTLKLDQVLQHIVEHLVAAFDCHAAFVYLWEPGRERLVLRGASEPYRHFIGRIELGRGEGLVGWSALTRKPAMLRERALEDPRFRYFPELEEERFQAMLTVPMTGSDGAVVAVVSMHTVAPQEFTDEHVRQVGAHGAAAGRRDRDLRDLREYHAQAGRPVHPLRAGAERPRRAPSRRGAAHAGRDDRARDGVGPVRADPGRARLGPPLHARLYARRGRGDMAQRHRGHAGAPALGPACRHRLARRPGPGRAGAGRRTRRPGQGRTWPRRWSPRASNLA